MKKLVSIIILTAMIFTSIPTISANAAETEIGASGEIYGTQKSELPWIPIITIGTKGDVNGDGAVNSSDALAVLRHSVDLEKLPLLYRGNADMNEDGVIDSSDALAILIQSISSGEVSQPDEPKPEKPKPEVQKPDSSYSMSSMEKEVVELVNKERAKAGLKPLKTNLKLSWCARGKSQDMFNNNDLNHTSPKYGDMSGLHEAYGITGYYCAGENIAYGYPTAQQVMNGWMNSPGHRENILRSSFTEIGVGYVNGYWTQEFTG